jgi:hypothetical protein
MNRTFNGVFLKNITAVETTNEPFGFTLDILPRAWRADAEARTDSALECAGLADSVGPRA